MTTNFHSVAVTQLKTCKVDLMRFHGLGEYDVAHNWDKHEPSFAKIIREKYSAEIISQAEKELGLTSVPSLVQPKPETPVENPQLVPQVQEELHQTENSKLVTDWEEAKQQLAYWKEREMTMRTALAVSYFPNPKEGSNKKVDSLYGLEVKAEYKMNRSVSKTNLSTVSAELETYCAENELEVPEVFRVGKYDLNLRTYKSLPTDLKAIVDGAVTSSLGTPTLTILRIPEKSNDSN